MKEEPEKSDALLVQTSRVARNKLFSRKLTACDLFQNIRFNGSREMRVSSLETKRDKRCNLLFNGTVLIITD